MLYKPNHQHLLGKWMRLNFPAMKPAYPAVLGVGTGTLMVLVKPSGKVIDIVLPTAVSIIEF